VLKIHKWRSQKWPVIAREAGPAPSQRPLDESGGPLGWFSSTVTAISRILARRGREYGSKVMPTFAVAQSFAQSQHVSGMGVPEIVKLDAWQFGCLDYLITWQAQATGLNTVARSGWYRSVPSAWRTPMHLDLTKKIFGFVLPNRRLQLPADSRSCWRSTVEILLKWRERIYSFCRPANVSIFDAAFLKKPDVDRLPLIVRSEIKKFRLFPL
jgi:hypothetical protein